MTDKELIAMAAKEVNGILAQMDYEEAKGFLERLGHVRAKRIFDQITQGEPKMICPKCQRTIILDTCVCGLKVDSDEFIEAVNALLDLAAEEDEVQEDPEAFAD